jgi:hypothetical protein
MEQSVYFAADNTAWHLFLYDARDFRYWPYNTSTRRVWKIHPSQPDTCLLGTEWCTMYTQIRGATQKFREFAHKRMLIITPSFHRLLRSSPLGHGYSDPSVFSWFHASLEVFRCECFKRLLRFCLNLLHCVKTTAFQSKFHFGEQEKSQGARSGE